MSNPGERYAAIKARLEELANTANEAPLVIGKTVFDNVQAELHEQVRANGFWDDAASIATAEGEGRKVLEKLMLITTELAEAAEEVRKPGWQAQLRYHREDGKPEGVGPELADAMIRLFDLAEWLGVSLFDEIVHKDEFNQTREYKHGKTA